MLLLVKWFWVSFIVLCLVAKCPLQEWQTWALPLSFPKSGHNNNNNNNGTERHNSRFFTISSLRCEPSPTRTVRSSCPAAIVCKSRATTSAYHMQQAYQRLQVHTLLATLAGAWRYCKGSALGRVGPVLVHCHWMRLLIQSASSVSVWQFPISEIH